MDTTPVGYIQAALGIVSLMIAIVFLHGVEDTWRKTVGLALVDGVYLANGLLAGASECRAISKF